MVITKANGEIITSDCTLRTANAAAAAPMLFLKTISALMISSLCQFSISDLSHLILDLHSTHTDSIHSFLRDGKIAVFFSNLQCAGRPTSLLMLAQEDGMGAHKNFNATLQTHQ